MRRLSTLLVALALVAVACAGTAETTTSPQESEVEAVAAPDFTLALGNGGSFTLSEESKPVYMIFWAEW